MTSKQINIKQELADRLDELRYKGLSEEIAQRSYSEAIGELFKTITRLENDSDAWRIKYTKLREEHDISERTKTIRMGLNRKKTERRTGLAYNGAAEEG